MRNWLYILDPKKDQMDGGPSTPGHVLALAQAEPRRDWWLSRRRYMQRGDRIWIYFATPEKKVAAMGCVEGEPYGVTWDAKYPWRFPATLHERATRALHNSPVDLVELTNQHPQGITLVKSQGLPLLLKRAGL
ncbi:hypothetical protein [Streptomyces sp. NPDC021622]|uniref:hypothetical protein n=1 Tax=Streptomyces sp. NPDC021622 TaxID=3155013 RepID=UPI0033E089DB